MLLTSETCFGYEDKVKFRGDEELFYRIKIRAKTANIAEVDEKLEGVPRYLFS